VSAGSPESILAVALTAAEASTVYADDGHTSVKEIGILNEQWAQSFVGDAISRQLRERYAHAKPQPYVTYETKASWLDYYFPNRSRGPYAKRLTDRSRFDLAVWKKTNGISGLIEIKDEPVMGSYSKSRDTEKLIGALRRWPDLRWGIFLFSTRATSNYEDDRKLAEHIEKKRDSVESVVSKVDSNFTCEFVHRNSNSKKCRLVHWSGAIIRRST
jgi:hypothetical protein